MDGTDGGADRGQRHKERLIAAAAALRSAYFTSIAAGATPSEAVARAYPTAPSARESMYAGLVEAGVDPIDATSLVYPEVRG